MHPGPLIPFPRVQRRQRRAGEMHCGGHDVRADHDVLHHGRMQVFVVGSGSAHPGRHPVVGRGQQRPGPARQVGDFQRTDPLPVRPVFDRHPRHCQLRQQPGRLSPGVEGGQEFAVGDQLAEHLPGHVRCGHGAVPGQRLGHSCQRRQHTGLGHNLGHLVEHPVGGVKDRPVVDVENLLPVLQHLSLRVTLVGAGNPPSGIGVGIPLYGQLEHQRVGDHRHADAGGLRRSLQVQRLGYVAQHMRCVRDRFGERPADGGDGQLHLVGRFLYHHLVGRDLFAQPGQVVDRPGEPPRLREPRRALVVAVAGHQPIPVLGALDGIGQIRLVRRPQLRRHRQRHHLLHDPARIGQHQTEAPLGVLLHRPSRGIFCLDHHRGSDGTSMGRDHHVGGSARGAGDHPRLLRVHVPARVSPIQCLREQPVERLLRGTRHAQTTPVPQSEVTVTPAPDSPEHP